MLIKRGFVRTSQPQVPVGINPYWLSRGLYAVSTGAGNALKPYPIPADTTISIGKTGLLLSQAVAGTISTGIEFPRKKLAARTELFLQECTSRRLYGKWLKANNIDLWSGESSDVEVGWTIHGTDWNSSANVFNGASHVSLVGSPHVICGTWNKDKNSGYGRVFVDGRELTRSSGTALTGVSDRTQSAASVVIGPDQQVSGISLFVAFDQDLTSDEIKSLSANPWQIFAPVQVPYFVSGGSSGGTTYAAGVNEIISASDLFGAIMAAYPAASESAAALDTLSSIFSVSSGLIELGSAGETSNYGAAALSAAATEAMTASDTGSATGSLVASSTDSASAADSSSLIAVMLASSSNSAAAVDTSSLTAVISASVADSASAVDLASLGSIVVASLADSAAASDINAATFIILSSVSEASTAGESSSRVSAFPASIVNAATASDSESVISSLLAASSESGSASDISATDGGTFASAAESAAASSSAGALASMVAAMLESSSASDTPIGVGLYGSAIAEPATAADLASVPGSGASGGIIETATAADSSIPALVFVRSLSETALSSDAVFALISGVAAAVEAAFALDDISGQQYLNVAIVESGNALDVQLFGSAGRAPARRVGVIPSRSRTFRRLS